jgi:transposase
MWSHKISLQKVWLKTFKKSRFMRKNEKVRRTFSTEFKKEKVTLIEQGKLRVSDVCKIYEVSQTAVRKWLVKYGKSYLKTERIVVEKISEEFKNLELLKKIAELERVIGKQQLQLIYKEAVIQIASEELGEDLEKKFDSQQ